MNFTLSLKPKLSARLQVQHLHRKLFSTYSHVERQSSTVDMATASTQFPEKHTNFLFDDSLWQKCWGRPLLTLLKKKHRTKPCLWCNVTTSKPGIYTQFRWHQAEVRGHPRVSSVASTYRQNYGWGHDVLRINQTCVNGDAFTKSPDSAVINDQHSHSTGCVYLY